jgi:hypothetical protein
MIKISVIRVTDSSPFVSKSANKRKILPYCCKQLPAMEVRSFAHVFLTRFAHLPVYGLARLGFIPLNAPGGI